MDNEIVIKIGDKEYHFKLKSQKIVGLEKQYGKNIFEIVQSLSFEVITDFIGASCISPENANKYEIMDDLLSTYSLQEISEKIMTQIAVKSGLIKQADIDGVDAEEAKN